jgi:hypothetical protein
MTAALGAALPAAATPTDGPFTDTSVKSECDPWSWGAMVRSINEALASRFVEKMALTSYEGSAEGSAVTDVSCVTSWTFKFINQREPKAIGARVTVDLTDGGTPEVLEAPGDRRTVASLANPQDPLDYVQEQGFRQPFYSLGQAAVGEEEQASFYIRTTDLEHVRLSNEGKISHSAFPDLPASVVPFPATFFRTGGVKDLPQYDCPMDQPYLWNADLGSGLKGTAVRRTYDEGTVNSPNLYVVDGLVAGWDETPDGLTTGTPERGEAYLYALCTNDRALGYAPSSAE